LEILQTMELNKQSQSAGDNSTQMQATTINNYYSTVSGIDEARARAICKEEYAIARQNWTQEAYVIADQRVHKLEDRLMPMMLAYDNSLSFFGDPAFQMSLRQAQISAATSDRESDYEMLSKLLLHRIEQGNNLNRRLGVCKAIEIVNQVTEEALIGLTIVYVVSKFVPVSSSIIEGLSVLDDLYGKIMDGKQLPIDNSWMENLDLLSAIRLGVQNANKFKKLEDYIPLQLKNYMVSGIDENSEEFTQLRNEFERIGFPDNCFMQHGLKPNFVKLAIDDDLEKIHLILTKDDGTSLVTPLTEEQKGVMGKALSLLKRDESSDGSLKKLLIEKWNTHTNLRMVMNWWNSLPVYFSITPAGVALANAYAQSKYSNIPSLY